MSRNVACLVTDSGATVMIDGKSYVVANDHPNYNKVITAIQAGRWNDIPELMDVRAAVRNYLSRDGDFVLTGDRVALHGVPFSAEVTDKVLNMIEAGATPEPLFRFLRKVRLNPSNAAQNELLLFCVANGFMIHEDGDIIAYKGVRDDYKDIHSGTIDNSVGRVITMERGQVDDDRDQTCSHGLHFASFEYASTWAGNSIRHLMIMKIHPRDVVSIPSDYNNQKGRCCRYEVIAESKDFTPLPKQEVYSDEDLGCEPDTDSYGIGYEDGEAAFNLSQSSNWRDHFERFAWTDSNLDSGEYADGFRDGWNDMCESARLI